MPPTVPHPRGFASRLTTRGFTLIEVAVAVAVLAITLTVLLALRTRDLELRGYARALTTATLLAQEKLGETEVGVFPLAGESNGTFTTTSRKGEPVTDRFPGFTWKRTVLATPFEGVREVRVRVAWPRGEQESTMELVGYVFRE